MNQKTDIGVVLAYIILGAMFLSCIIASALSRRMDNLKQVPVYNYPPFEKRTPKLNP